jgi:glutathione synthase/RimK-type ligase-like ATP-grasp enzyme
VDSKAQLESALDRLDLGPDGTALVQEYVEPIEGAIVRVEVLDGQYLYAIRIVRDAGAGFNLCPADICQTPEGASTPSAELGACPVSPPAGLTVTRFDAPTEAIDTVIRLARAASIDVGGIEYLVSKADGRIYYYDVNATSNFVANAEAVVGFDPTARFADFIVRRARREARAAAA